MPPHKGMADRHPIGYPFLDIRIGKRMATYDIIGKLVLSFIFDNDQQDVLLDSGTIETDGKTVWFIETDGKRYESITTPNVVDVGLGLGVLRAR